MSRRGAGLVAAAAVVVLVIGVVVARSRDGGGHGRIQPAPRGTIVARDTRFSPAELRVPAGAVGVFRNDDSVEHTFTADGGMFDSGRVAPGKSFSFPFPTSGVVTFHCEIHPSMTGRISIGQG